MGDEDYYGSQDYWSDSEQGIDRYFVVFLSLLAIALTCSKFLHDSPRLSSALPEAGMIIVIGAIAGFILFELTSLSNYDGADDDGNINENVAEGLLSFSPTIFFKVLLPPIIFNSGFQLKREVFFRHIVPISLFACVGTAISTVVVTFLLELVKSFGLLGEFKPRFTELLTFGALISATDPVSTLAVFQAKKVDPQLFYLVFGESVLNDAVGLVLFKTCSELVGNEDNLEKVFQAIVDFLLSFTIGFVGGMVLGLVAGIASAFFLKKVDMRHTPLLELCLFFLIMYLPFFCAESLELSGIVTILFTGISAQRYATHNLSETTEEAVDKLFRMWAHLAETSIFLELGLSVVSYGEKFGFQWAFTGFAIAACLIGRALNIYPLRSIYNAFLLREEAESHLKEAFDPSNSILGNPSMLSATTLTPAARKDLKIRNNTANMLWFSGLRGAVAYACAKTFPNEFGNRPVFLFTTMAIVLFTVFFFGCTTEVALNAFQIEMMVDEEKYMEENGTADKMDYINEFEKKYIYPRIIRDYARPCRGTGVELQNVSVVQDQDTIDTQEKGRNGSPNRLARPQNMSQPYHLEQVESAKRRKQRSLYDYGHSLRNIGQGQSSSINTNSYETGYEEYI